MENNANICTICDDKKLFIFLQDYFESQIFTSQFLKTSYVINDGEMNFHASTNVSEHRLCN